jgi:hypothetical protein
LGPDLVIAGNFNLNMIQKKEFKKIKWLINLYRTFKAFIGRVLHTSLSRVRHAHGGGFAGSEV